MEKVICAAIWYDDGVQHKEQPINITTGFVVCGHRHHNCMVTAAILSGQTEYQLNGTCGFLTSDNKFLDRYEAYELASTYLYNLNDLPPHRVARLYSEDLY